MNTSGILSFDECELALRADLFETTIHFFPERKQYGLILSEIPLSIEFKLGDFSFIPIKRNTVNFYKPYALLICLPETIDLLYVPCVGEVLSALLSFSFRRRMKNCRLLHIRLVNNEDELSDELFRYLPCGSVGTEASLQLPLTEKEQKNRISDLEKIYEKIMRINKEDYLAVIRALHQYQLSLLAYREDVGLAFSILVSSIESMAKQFVDKNFQFRDLTDHAEWENLFLKSGMPEESEKQIKDKLLKKEHFISRRFRDFIIANLPESFWTSPDSKAKEFDDYLESLRAGFPEDKTQKRSHFEKWWHLYKNEIKPNKEELSDILKKIYNVRSKFFHVGESPPAEVIGLYETASIKINFKSHENRLKFVRSIPCFFWFERVVHDSILNFVMNKL